MLLSWCGWTYARYMQFYENVDMSMLWSICYRGGTKKGATATNPKMMPQQHIVSGSSRRYRCKRSGRERVMQDDGVIPVAGFPWVDDMATRRNMQVTISDTMQTWGSTHSTHMHSVHGRSSRWLYLSKRALSERIKFVEEVVVHGDGIRSSGSHLAIVQTP